MTERDRAERALARAFREHADEQDFVVLDPVHLKARSLGADAPGPRRVRPGLLGLVAAAVVLVLAVPVAVTLGQVFNARAGAPAALPADAPAPVTEAAGAGVAAEADSASPVGRRWESMLDVAVQVPDTWGYDVAPNSDWCAEPGYQRPDGPFVQRNPLSQAVSSILCAEPVPDDLRQVHLTWRSAEPTDADGVVAVGSAGEWLRVSRVVGSAFLTVEVPADQRELAEQILATAQVTDVDPRGCPAVWPSGRPASGTVDGFAGVESAVVCQYVLDADRPGPDLVGSWALAEVAARRLAADIQGQPTRADLAGEPTTCDRGEALLIRLGNASGDTREVKLVTGLGCGPFGLDDGSRIRHPSRATCADLITGPLWQAVFDKRTAEWCAPR